MRKEHDFLGDLEVPDEVYYGVQTMRAVENFNITGQKLDPDFIVALAKVKKAAALANMDTGRLRREIGDVLVQAADEIIAGGLIDQFPVDPIQGGAGTSINMNMNEVLCNRALELRGEAKGRYDIISPNNHANMAQSTNDAFPTGIKVCLSKKSDDFLAALERLATELEKKATAYRGILKMGRTHLQDAVPITLGQEMGAYASAVRRCMKRTRIVQRAIHTINMGGTAVGTGLNAEPAYIKAVAKRLSEITGETYRTSQNIIDATNNTDAFADFSSALKNAALVLIKMSNDFRLMASGPRCGLGEITIPANEPGSSIMPGKVNPTQCESVTMVAVQVMGNDAAIGFAASQGNFELNVFMPVIIYNFLQSTRLLTDSLKSFNDRCAVGIKANREKMHENLHRSLMLVTALNPYIGYENAAKTAHKAFDENISLKEACVALGFLTAEKFDEVFHPEEMV